MLTQAKVTLLTIFVRLKLRCACRNELTFPLFIQGETRQNP